MNVELLYFDGCPHYEALLPHLRELLKREGVDTELTLVRVETRRHAEQLRFLGSPTVRIDGQDVDAASRQRDDFGLKCRIYQTAEGLKGAPPDEWILASIRKSEHV